MLTALHIDDKKAEHRVRSMQCNRMLQCNIVENWLLTLPQSHYIKVQILEGFKYLTQNAGYVLNQNHQMQKNNAV
jgi:hypothetical protein